ncbi:hypothetical protein LSH36_299g02006 [Paralvinella palmiformis]|uniref:Beta-hexosaminidase n=1 Tax=Paralvinella palmiformis TaxID=53620 RepID=A0AAD9JI18_9ANNE|nr:hypothetical protein LSH36_299g02006 [Paralvinella palmiformis]
MALLMMIYRIIFVIVVLIGSTSADLSWFYPASPLTGFVAAPGAPWPMPESWQNSTSQMTLDPLTFQFTSDLTDCDVIDNAIQRYMKYIDLDPNGVIDPGLTQLTGLTLTVDDTNCAQDYYPHQGMDESYSLTISGSTEGSLSAKTIWGALRGLETFSQLLYLKENKMYRINQTTIIDAPRFPFRGFLIDTSRHFVTVEVILNILDLLSWDKFNVLHWHISDDPSFPYTSRTYPDLTMGAYTPDHVYSRDNITKILYEARLRGIRLLPEFDTPGHSWSWGEGYPALLTPCWGEGLEGGPFKPNYPYHGPSEVINPMEEYSYEFMDNFFQEIAEDFPDGYIHLGLDEVNHNCWASNPNISSWMEDMGFTELNQVEQYYVERIIEIVARKGSYYIIWEDPINKGVKVNESAIVVVWMGNWEESMSRITSQGHYVILSSPWYLNYISYGEDWRTYYAIEPLSFTNNATLWKLVKGGEACMWGEYVDSTNIISRTWPRISTVGERLWSTIDVKNVDDAQYRLHQHRCRILRRGMPAQPIMNSFCGDYEWDYDRSPHNTPLS